MEVFIGNIPPNLDTGKIERFIFAVVNTEQVFGSGAIPSYGSSTPPAPPATTAIVPINKGFFFKRVPRNEGLHFGFLTFARRKVALWFIEYTQWQPFVRNHGLRVKEGREEPLPAFVSAIAENATDQQPSASVQKAPPKYSFGVAHVGYWGAPFRFNYTHAYVGGRLYLSIEDKNVIRIQLNHDTVTFLPRDVKTLTLRQVKSAGSTASDVGCVMFFELKTNPRIEGDLRHGDDAHAFRLPTRIIQLIFGKDKRASDDSQNLWRRLEVLLAGVPQLKYSKIQTYQDKNAPFLAKFFQRSKSLDVELALLRESLLRNELLNMSALVKLSPKLDHMINQDQQALALRVLKNLVPKLEARQERGVDEEAVLRVSQKLWEEACAEATGNDSRGFLSVLDPTPSPDDDYLSKTFSIDVTPTRVLVSGPHTHVSNRVIRAYSDHWHHFARVTFSNEDRGGATTIKANYGLVESERYIQSRVLKILQRGINVAGRHWEMLAWSSSSMSAHTVWFVTPFRDKDGSHVHAEVIRRELGDFTDVARYPAMYGARLSQAFSATARTVEVDSSLILHMPDIETPDRKMAYTDGVGQISPELMAEVWEKYVTSALGEPRKRKLLKAAAPSAIQIRIGGHKGCLTVNPRLQGKQLALRPSMSKFVSPHQDLEVANSSARCLSAKLNRPLINALDDRGVPATALLDIQKEAIAHIGRARTHFDETARLCSAYSFGTGCDLHILFQKLHKHGMGTNSIHSDSFFLVLAKAVIAAALGDMKRKARIPVRGVTLIGVADEFAFLKEGEVFAQVEHVDLGQEEAIWTAICTRSTRTSALYTIYEDERLFLPTPQPGTTFHAKTRPKELDRYCDSTDLANFFADFMLNDFIGLVSHMHLRIADASKRGSLDGRCKQLAMLHSQATDFRKTGVAVKRTQLPRMDEPIIPDFLAQGEPRQGRLTYLSTRVLDYLYRAVSWNQTDTPSLDKNTDPETGLEPDYTEDYGDEDDLASEIDSEFGSDFDSLVEQHVPQGAARDPSARATFKDNTFPDLLERIAHSNTDWLPTSASDADSDEQTVVEEGYRYVSLFIEFTRRLRSLSRMIAEYHPENNGSANGIGGAMLVSEVHLLTGRLPWAKVARKTCHDRDSKVLDSMQPLCALLRKNICRISEAEAFAPPVKSQIVKTEADVHPIAFTGVASLAANGASGSQQTRVQSGPAGGTGQTSRAASDYGSHRNPIEIDSDSDSDSDSSDDVTVIGSRRGSFGPIGSQPRRPLVSVTNVVPPSSQASAPSSQASDAGSKRKASQDLPFTRSPRFSSKSSSHDSSSTRNAATVAEEEEAEEGEFTVVSAQKVVDSLWRACCFFASPHRPRYSNVYGYNTFMITLVLHLLSMIETLKHLQRNTMRRTGRQPARPAQTTQTQVQWDDAASEAYTEDDYSLTEDAVSALTLGTMLMDLSHTNAGYD
ncbi:related to RNA-directed RNA polymerase [Moesziomyces antarcticus]|uniref:RNA-dependent RNA polymerase n=1 Tax=Pseudozyma antarctica TaxID=84753 RepID=A0A5C3FJ44_PSEA2|nr:related to RNA-directed RNA polymerase [Moesziomyces antarcticus]